MSRTPVCVITNAYPDFDGSYHGIFVRRTAEDMADRGWRSHVLGPRVFTASEPYHDHGGHTVRRFRFPTEEKLLIEYEGTPYFRVACLIANGLLAASRTIRRERCALVHAHWAFPAGIIGLAASRLSGRRLVLTVHGSDCRLARERGGPATWLFARVARGSFRIISVSEDISSYLVSIGCKPGRIITRPMGADERIFPPPDSDSPERNNSVISTRNLLPLYRVGDLMEAFAAVSREFPESGLTLAGDGSEKQGLEEACRARGVGDRVFFTGRLGQRELARMLCAHSVYVSTSPAEGASVSLLEAMICGCLPVVAGIPSNREWVEHGVNGLLFEPGNAESLAAQLRRALSDSGLRERASSRNPELVRARGTWSAQLDAVEQCYRAAAGGPEYKETPVN